MVPVNRYNHLLFSINSYKLASKITISCTKIYLEISQKARDFAKWLQVPPWYCSWCSCCSLRRQPRQSSLKQGDQLRVVDMTRASHANIGWCVVIVAVCGYLSTYQGSCATNRAIKSIMDVSSYICNCKCIGDAFLWLTYVWIALVFGMWMWQFFTI